MILSFRFAIIRNTLDLVFKQNKLFLFNKFLQFFNFTCAFKILLFLIKKKYIYHILHIFFVIIFQRKLNLIRDIDN